MTDRVEVPTETTPVVSPSRKLRRQLSSTQVMFAVILAIGLMLAIQFSSQIEADQSLEQIHKTILEEIDLLRREHVDLAQQLEFVDSDAYVADWAHSEGRMVREGEVLVIPVPSTISLQQIAAQTENNTVVTVDTTIPEPKKWEMWWSLFFDTSPPEFGSG